MRYVPTFGGSLIGAVFALPLGLGWRIAVFVYVLSVLIVVAISKATTGRWLPP